MANWTTPKVDYWDTPRPVGGEDYKRIEGNTQYLKEQTDGLKNGSIKAGKAKDADTVGGVHAKIIVPSTSNLLSATTERYTRESSTERIMLKRFKLGYPGKCTLTFQYYGTGHPSYPAKFTAELWMNNEKHSQIGSVQSTIEQYNTYETEVIIPFPAMEIVIWGESGLEVSEYRGRVRNAYIKGSLIQIDPNVQVVVN